MIIKNVTAKLRSRKSTPAPMTKDGGRKRFIASPFVDDKQIRKKIDFGSELVGETEVGMAGEPDPHVEEELEVASKKSAVEASSKVDVREREASNSKSSELPDDGGNPDDMAGQPIGEEEMTVEEEDKLKVLPKESRDDGIEGTRHLELCVVNFPDLGIHTNDNRERQLVPFPFGESRDSIVEGVHEQPKLSLIHLVNPHAAEDLDRMASQPLLAGAATEADRPDMQQSSTTLILQHEDTDMGGRGVPAPSPTSPR